MKNLKLLGAILLLSVIILTSFSCTRAAATSATPIVRTAVVTKGTLTNAITATGNLVYSTTKDLAFEIPGYVEEVLISEGDTVKKDQELVNLNTADWQDQITSLTKALYNSQKALTNSKRTLANAQNSLIAKQSAVTDKEIALNQAQIDIDLANYNLSKITEVKRAQDNVDAAQLALDVAVANQEGSQIIGFRTTELANANKMLESVLATTTTNLSTSAALAITQANQNITLKKKAYTDAQRAISDARTAVVNAQLDIDQALLDSNQAEQDVVNAQANLDESKSKSPIIKAPFDGYITSLKVKGGDEVKKGTVAMTIADPNQFEASVLVTETDIDTVKLDGVATVSLDALSNLIFPARITWIAPTATINSGVVNYKVTVTLSSLKPISARQAFPSSSSSIAGQPGDLPSGAAPPTGFTRPSGTAIFGETPPAGFSRPNGIRGTGSADNTTMPNVTLKQGLSATVSIISQQKDDVLYIPSRAIARLGSNQSVKVINGTTVETRTVTTGMTDGTNTEILSGLTEGEKVTYTTSTASSTTNRTGGGIPGMGRIGG